jgi:hypothetical protein
VVADLRAADLRAADSQVVLVVVAVQVEEQCQPTQDSPEQSSMKHKAEFFLPLTQIPLFNRNLI